MEAESRVMSIYLHIITKTSINEQFLHERYQVCVRQIGTDIHDAKLGLLNYQVEDVVLEGYKTKLIRPFHQYDLIPICNSKPIPITGIHYTIRPIIIFRLLLTKKKYSIKMLTELFYISEDTLWRYISSIREALDEGVKLNLPYKYSDVLYNRKEHYYYLV